MSARQAAPVAREVMRGLGAHVAEIWEELARATVPRLELGGHSWGPASSWWGPGLDRRPLEVEVMATSLDGGALLLGYEAEWSPRASPAALLAELRRKATLLHQAQERKIVYAAWVPGAAGQRAGIEIVTADRMLRVLR